MNAIKTNNIKNTEFKNSHSILIKNGRVLNVFTGELEHNNVLIEGEKIVGIGNYTHAVEVIDAKDKIIIPSFIDAHMHIESTLLTPPELSKIAVPHGTGAVVTDPHEIANVCGINGINYMMQMSANIPMDVYFTLPSCVPATNYDESGANLSADDLYPFYKYENVVGLSEVMDFPSVIAREENIMKKINDAKNCKKVVCGHAPGLTGESLKKYVAAGIQDEHECVTFDEALEKLNCGQTIIIREGSSAKNLKALAGLFDDKYWRNCLFCTDDKAAADIIREGHIDYIIRRAIDYGCKPINAIIMATIQTARHFQIQYVGAINPGYYANINIIDSLESINIDTVLHKGCVVYSNSKMTTFNEPHVDESLLKEVRNTFNLKTIRSDDFKIEIPQNKKIRVIEVVPGEILTKENVVDCVDENDVVKIAVCERHKNTGHIGLGFLKGTGMKKGALASSISHDSHNLITFGKNDDDMALAANTIKDIGGGVCVVVDSKIIFKQELPIAGLISDDDGYKVAQTNEKLYQTAKLLGFNDDINPFMTTGFCSLTVVPELRLTTKGLFDVSKQEFVDLFI